MLLLLLLAQDAARLLPDSTLAYVEIAEPKRLIATIYDHPLWGKIEKALENEEARRVVAALEERTGMTYREILEAVLDGGLVFSAGGGGMAWLAKARDAETLAKIHEALLELWRENPGIEPVEYRGLTAHKVGGGVVAVAGEWMIVTDGGAVGRKIADLYVDGGGATLADDPDFAAAKPAEAHTAWGWVDVRTLRKIGAAPQLFGGRTDNFLVELVAGAVINHLQRVPAVTATLDVDAAGLRLSVAVEHEDGWTAGPRAFAFGAAPAPMGVKDELLSLSAHRDLAAMWASADDLFEQNVLDGMTEADATLTTLFSGMDFGDEVLTAFEPQIRIVAARRTFAEGEPTPAIRLPAFAAVFRLREPDRVRDDFRGIFQSLVGFTNIQGAMQGAPQLLQDIERDGDSLILTSAYKRPKEGEPTIHYNFSPSLAFAGDRMIVSSTTALARELVGAGEHSSESANTFLRLNGAVLRDVLADNRAQLVVQNQIDEGNSPEEAAAAVDGLLELIGAARDATLRLSTREKTLQLDVEVIFER